MKKFTSIFLSLVMVFGILAALPIFALANNSDEAKITKIELISEPYILANPFDYFDGEHRSASDLKLRVTFEDGTKKVTTASMFIYDTGYEIEISKTGAKVKGTNIKADFKVEYLTYEQSVKKAKISVKQAKLGTKLKYTGFSSVYSFTPSVTAEYDVNFKWKGNPNDTRLQYGID